MEIVVAVLAVIVIGNVLLTAAVLRRLAAHERKLAALGGGFMVPNGLGPGEPLPAFITETTSGQRVDESHLFPGPAAVAFFSAHCEACLAHAPEFEALVRRDGIAALAVLTGEGGTAEPLLAALGSLTVVREREAGGALTRSFKVDTYPTYFALEGGHVVAAAGSAGELGDLLAMTTP